MPSRGEKLSKGESQWPANAIAIGRGSPARDSRAERPEGLRLNALHEGRDLVVLLGHGVM